MTTIHRILGTERNIHYADDTRAVGAASTTNDGEVYSLDTFQRNMTKILLLINQVEEVHKALDQSRHNLGLDDAGSYNLSYNEICSGLLNGKIKPYEEVMLNKYHGNRIKSQLENLHEAIAYLDEAIGNHVVQERQLLETITLPNKAFTSVDIGKKLYDQDALKVEIREKGKIPRVFAILTHQLVILQTELRRFYQLLREEKPLTVVENIDSLTIDQDDTSADPKSVQELRAFLVAKQGSIKITVRALETYYFQKGSDKFHNSLIGWFQEILECLLFIDSSTPHLDITYKKVKIS